MRRPVQCRHETRTARSASGSVVVDPLAHFLLHSVQVALYRQQVADIANLTQKERDLDGMEEEVRQRIGNILQLIRDTDCAPAFQKELRNHIESMTVLPSGMLKIEGGLIGLLPMGMVAGAGFEPATSGL